MSEPNMRVRFPILPDAEFESIVPHNDGHPWKKACRDCAFRTNDPQQLGDRYQASIRHGPPGTLFYCVHRTPDGAYDDNTGLPLSNVRVCASYAACNRDRAIVA